MSCFLFCQQFPVKCNAMHVMHCLFSDGKRKKRGDNNNYSKRQSFDFKFWKDILTAGMTNFSPLVDV